jgi:flagellar hook assembly protein FlgD
VDDPVVLSPPSGAVVGESVTVTATSSSAALRFRVDGLTITTDTEAPFSASLPMTGLALGLHSLDVVACTDEVTCLGPTSDPVTVTYRQLSPSVTSVAPTPFSPNGDGRRDTTRVTYLLDDASAVTLEAWRNGSRVDRDVVSATPLSAGSHSYVWNGRASGALPSGTYELRLLTQQATAYGAPIIGTGTATVTIDLAKPAFTAPTRSRATVYPVRDAFRDTVTFTTRVTEPVSGVRLAVQNSRGRTVRTIDVGSSAGGLLRATWNGRSATGAVVSPGSYRAVFSGRDVAGNLGRSTAASVTVSDAYLVARTYTRTVSAYASLRVAYTGSCSEVGRIDRWKGALGYYSMYRWIAGFSCDPYAENTDVALATHAASVPTAVKYGSLRIDVRGGTAPGARDEGVLMYQRRDGELSGAKVIAPAVGWHAGMSVPGSSVVANGRVRWWFGTVAYRWYDVEKYRVTLRYFVITDPTPSAALAVSSVPLPTAPLVDVPADIVAEALSRVDGDEGGQGQRGRALAADLP